MDQLVVARPVTYQADIYQAEFNILHRNPYRATHMIPTDNDLAQASGQLSHECIFFHISELI